MFKPVTDYDLAGQIRKTRAGIEYKVISFSNSCIINHQYTWLIEYLNNGKRFYKPECLILKDKIKGEGI